MKTICEICLKEIEGKTHNPSLIRAEVCCNECNINVVIRYMRDLLNKFERCVILISSLTITIFINKLNLFERCVIFYLEKHKQESCAFSIYFYLHKIF